MTGWRQQCHRYSSSIYGPSPRNAEPTWIGDERIAVGGLPTATTLPALAQNSITHVVNCRSAAQTWVSQDLAVERALLGPSRVVHAPMWDSGYPQSPHLWSAAALFAAQVLTNDAAARVLIHCHQGRSRSVMLTYAVLRLRGHSRDQATDLIRCHRVQARIVDAYTGSVEQWLAAGANSVGPLRIR